MECLCFLRTFFDKTIVRKYEGTLSWSSSMIEEEDATALGNGERPSGHSIAATVFNSSVQTAYRQRFGEEFRGPTACFGAGIEYKSSSQKGVVDMQKW